jgi:hypothetical protein
MLHSLCSQYKGCRITTRWTEIDCLRTKDGRQFLGSFSVESADAQESWQAFPITVFHSWQSAASNALDAARRSIDFHPSER